jgi:hypothetical protein
VVAMVFLVVAEALVPSGSLPGIQATVERDLDIVARLARSLEARTRWARSPCSPPASTWSPRRGPGLPTMAPGGWTRPRPGRR